MVAELLNVLNVHLLTHTVKNLRVNPRKVCLPFVYWKFERTLITPQSERTLLATTFITGIVALPNDPWHPSLFRCTKRSCSMTMTPTRCLVLVQLLAYGAQPLLCLDHNANHSSKHIGKLKTIFPTCIGTLELHFGAWQEPGERVAEGTIYSTSLISNGDQKDDLVEDPKIKPSGKEWITKCAITITSTISSRQNKCLSNLLLTICDKKRCYHRPSYLLSDHDAQRDRQHHLDRKIMRKRPGPLVFKQAVVKNLQRQDQLRCITINAVTRDRIPIYPV